MTPKEIVYQALAHQEADVIPYNVSIEEVLKRLYEYYGGRENLPKYENYIAGMGWEIRERQLPRNRFLDPFGVVWQDGTTFQITEPVLKQPSLKGFKFPKLIRDEQLPKIQQFCIDNYDKFLVFGLGLLFFERSWALRGMANLFLDYILEPKFVEELYEQLMELELQALDKLLSIKELDGIQFGDDFGQQKGLIMGLGYWRRYLKPRLAKMYGKVRAAKKVVLIHSCGDNSEIMGELIDIGVQIFNPLQPEAMDIFELKRRYGKHITFWGGIGTQALLPKGAPEKIKKEIKATAKYMSQSGGFILETTKPIMSDVPTENAAAALEAIIEAAHRQFD